MNPERADARGADVGPSTRCHPSAGEKHPLLLNPAAVSADGCRAQLSPPAACPGTHRLPEHPCWKREAPCQAGEMGQQEPCELITGKYQVLQLVEAAK
ncbi:uncharacterized protein O9250_005847 isoform 2-T2 [Rhynochetos jubatus]